MKRRLCIGIGCIVLGTASTALAIDPTSAFYARGSTNVFWFMHLSDSHIGATVLEGPHAVEHLDYALNEAVSIINPTFVVNTGDLVDGSANNIPTWGQDQAEWDAYRQVVDQAGMTPSFYFDLPGNHDGYDDVGLLYYLTNSLQGQNSGELYVSWTVGLPLGEYYFFGLDTAGIGSGKFIENPAVTADELTALDHGLQDHASAQLAFVLGHHRLDQPANGDQVSALLKNAGGGYYIHGHVHTYSEYLAGDGTIVVNQIDSIGKKNNDDIAVGVVDHNGFTYRATDVVAPWPFIVVTAPTSRWLRGGADLNPYAYDVCKDRTDNPVRALVFADMTPSQVWVEINGSITAPMSLAAGSDTLWEGEVDTSSLPQGVYDVAVVATVNGDDFAETITTTFVDGPCDELPVDGSSGGQGGGGGQGGAENPVGGGAPAGGSGANEGGGAAVGGDSSVGDPAFADSPFADDDDDGGCNLAAAGPTSSGPGQTLWLCLLALGAGWRRRSYKRRPSRCRRA